MPVELSVAKQLVWEHAGAWPRPLPPEQRAAEYARRFAPELVWHGFQPIGRVEGRDALAERVMQPLYAAFPDWRRVPYLFLAGVFEGSTWVASMGDGLASFMQEWQIADDIVIPPSRERFRLRYGEFCRVEQGKAGPQIVEMRSLADLPAALLPLGYDLIPAGAGRQLWPPGPATGDGVQLGEAAGAEAAGAATAGAATAQTLALVEQMIFGGLNQYDGEDPDSQDLVKYWHPEMQWHGPRGVGSSLGLDEFRYRTQGPILQMVPDRKGVGHQARIAEGCYAASTGWPASVGTMAGDFLDWRATGEKMRWNVMDFWRREGDLLLEDWVLIDMIDGAAQAGIDVWKRAGLR
ncbi:MAG: nuclear transport factor 2 family protein [Anaerolineaceae bacterium]|nr:nuclear transport factor 2 family protein [Anaerolineaceae bacterium]